jgi:hypothetical protein
MTKSEIFKAAHRMAKGTVKAVGNYEIAFSLALKEINGFLAQKIMIRDESVRRRRFQKGWVVMKQCPYSTKREEKYIKEHSRIIRFFESIAAYNQAAEENKNLGKLWMPTDLKKTQCLAYEYFT